MTTTSTTPLRFSIIIPALNEEKCIQYILQDLQEQTHINFEVYLVDGNSQDQTVNIAKKFTGLNLKILSSQVRNVSHQRNLGASKAKGDWLVFFDADTRINPLFLQELEKSINTTEMDSFTCFMEPDSTDMADKVIARACNLGFLAARQLNTPYAWGACMGCKRSIFAEVKGFSEEISFQEDCELARRLTRLGYTFNVLEHPTFTNSFRRFRSEGRLKLIRKAAILNLRTTLKGFEDISSSSDKLYPMEGGTLYESDTLTADAKDIYRLPKRHLKKLRSFVKKLNY